MCGVVGYISQQSPLAISDFMAMVKSLDYRGYDSWGFAQLIDNELAITKDIGKLINTDLPGQSLAILGHTRWATHGKVTKENTHPHLSDNGSIALVHNGIIDNHQELKSDLAKNIKLQGQTDSEVLAHLLGQAISNDTFTDLYPVLQQLQGAYALCFMRQNENRLYFARKDSPLLLGVGEGEHFLSSDVTSFLSRTNKVIYLEDGDYGYIDGEQVVIFNGNKKVHRNISIIEWDIEKAQKGDFEHFMLKEIVEQVDTVKLSLMQDKEMIVDICADIEHKKVFMLACGSSYNAAKAAEYEFLQQGKMMQTIHAHEFYQYLQFVDSDTLIIALSQSGETADLVNAAKLAKQHDAEVVSIVNVQGSTLDRLSDKTIYMNAGPEICVLSTKSYTAQVSILMLLAGCMKEDFDSVQGQMGDLVRCVYYLISETTKKKRSISHIYCAIASICSP